MTIRIARAQDWNRIRALYAACGYGGGIAPADTAWVAESAGDPIGVVRIAPEGGVLVLRGMQIVEPWRRRGVASQMLRMVAEWLGDRECYCVPYAHLVHFYGQIGFAEMAPGAEPSFLIARAEEYRRRGLKVTIMARVAVDSI